MNFPMNFPMNSPVEYLVRTTAVFALAFAVTWMLRRGTPALRHVVWVCAFGIAAATPALMRWGPRIRIEQPLPAPPVLVAVNGVISAAPAEAPRREEIPWVEIVWIAGMLPFAIRAANAMRKARFLVRDAEPLEVRDLSLPAGLRAAETSAVATAMTVGVFRPWILLPREHREWTPERLRAVLLHELEHVRRRDCLMQWLPNVVCAVNWFHPLAWLARSEMLCESERACDDAVIRSGIPGSAFARELVEMAEAIQMKGSSIMSIALTTKLERRIVRLMDATADRRPLTAWRIALGAVVAVAVLAPMAGVRAEEVMRAPAVEIPAVSAVPQPAVTPKAGPAVVAAVRKTPRVVAQVAQTAAAQMTGSLSGVVKDPSGGVVPGASVVVAQIPDGNGAAGGGRGGGVPVYSTTTDATGQWSFSSLPVGSYGLEVDAPGFAGFKKAATVSQGVNNQMNAFLNLGRLRESVTITAAAPNKAAALAAPAAQGAPRVGGNVQAAKLIKHVPPVYPQAARDAGEQGSVSIMAVIGIGGFVLLTQVTSPEAPPDLAQAALDAVKQWQYEPTLLNGQPVEVVTEITVNFALQ